jgi:hypothetical protein
MTVSFDFVLTIYVSVEDPLRATPLSGVNRAVTLTEAFFYCNGFVRFTIGNPTPTLL